MNVIHFSPSPRTCPECVRPVELLWGAPRSSKEGATYRTQKPVMAMKYQATSLILNPCHNVDFLTKRLDALRWMNRRRREKT